MGENAFGLDPLSSSGVEKAMRQALQVVIAVNTLLRDPAAAPLAQEFFESRLLESAAARIAGWLLQRGHLETTARFRCETFMNK